MRRQEAAYCDAGLVRFDAPSLDLLPFLNCVSVVRVQVAEVVVPLLSMCADGPALRDRIRHELSH